jgi:hypothetical protein
LGHGDEGNKLTPTCINKIAKASLIAKYGITAAFSQATDEVAEEVVKEVKEDKKNNCCVM